MTVISFFAHGLVKGQPRPRAFAMKGKGVRMYDPGTAEGWKSAIAAAAKPFLGDGRIAEPVILTCTFYFPRPKSHYFTGKRSHILRDTAPFYNSGKPDIDNAAKAVMDALTVLGLLADDALVVRIYCSKTYVFPTESTGARITIESATS